MPAVGENLQDHLAIDTGFHCIKGTSLFSSAGEVEGWAPTTMEYLNNPLCGHCKTLSFCLTPSPRISRTTRSPLARRAIPSQLCGH